MDTKIQILYGSTEAEKFLTNVEAHCLLNGCNGGKELELKGVKRYHKLEDDPLNLNPNLNLGSKNGVAKLDILHNKNDLFFKLKQINMSACQLSEIPNAIITLKYLRVLDLSNNLLESLPVELGNLHNLVTLKLPGNKLKSLPKSLKKVQQLNYLDLSCNKFSEVPDVLYYGLRVLRVLNLSCNLLTKFNDPPACVNKLVALGLSNNILNQLPLWIFDNLCQLQILDLSENQLGLRVELNSYCSTGIFESLQLLNIENCNYSCEKIQVFSQFRCLKILYCGNKGNFTERTSGKNYFGNLEMEVFKNFREIKDLHLQNVEISTLPSDFNCFKNLELLNLSNNTLSWLPEGFCNLITLKILNLTSNQLLLLPDDIGNLVNLQQIHLSNNKICHIPESFYNLTSLQFVDFYNNQIEKIDLSIFKEKNLKGIDLGLNCLQFGGEDGVDIFEIVMLYNCLKDSFRKHFSCRESRSDLQKISSNSEKSNDSHSGSQRCSTSSFDIEGMSDIEDLSINCAEESYPEDENWEKEHLYGVEEDDMFDPNDLDKLQPLRKTWSLEFRSNYCPANYHVPSVMKTCIKNFKLASENKPSEGQFDSD